MSWESDLSPSEKVEWDKWVRHVREDVVTKMDDSAFVMQFVPEHDTDIKFAVELGLAIMLDKPILAVVHPGTPLPGKLRDVADVVVYADIDTEAGQDLLQREIKNFMEAI